MESNAQGPERLGIIAGNRSFPLIFARQARLHGVKHLVAVGFEGETDPALGDLVDELVWLRVGQLSKLIRAFQSRRVSTCVMLGQVAPRSLFDLRPDWRAMTLLFRLKEKNAHTIFGALADELHKEGIELVEPIPWLKGLMPTVGYACGPRLRTEQREDVAFGFRIAKEIARLEIGQTVVVKSGTVLAVEGFDGTDACLRRGGELAGKSGGAVAVKVAKQNHDMRFDIPCIGPQTLESCAASRIAVLAFEAGSTVLLEQERVQNLAKENRIAFVAHAGS